jgi:mannan endo-1,4-beta-mannosidase
VRRIALLAAAVAVAGAVLCGSLSGCSAQLGWQPKSGPQPQGATTAPSRALQPKAMLPGAYEAGVPGSWTGLTQFASATGVQPKIALYYSSWYEGFRTSFAEQARSRGAYAFVQIQPNGVTLKSIADGKQDTYLRGYALSVRAYGQQVILSFGHEMNGNWYSWGAGHVSAKDFVAAWRHVVDVFRAEGALNVTWVWTVNSLNAASSPLAQWWPGAAWVNWIGIDGYYYRSTDTFNSVFGTTLAQIRKFTDDPFMISEVAVGTTSDRETQIAGMFSGAEAADAVGLIWFDESQDNGLYHQDWRLENDPDALAAFKAAAQDAGLSAGTAGQATTSSPAGQATTSSPAGSTTSPSS